MLDAETSTLVIKSGWNVTNMLRLSQEARVGDDTFNICGVQDGGTFQGPTYGRLQSQFRYVPKVTESEIMDSPGTPYWSPSDEENDIYSSDSDEGITPHSPTPIDEFGYLRVGPLDTLFPSCPYAPHRVRKIQVDAEGFLREGSFFFHPILQTLFLTYFGLTILISDVTVKNLFICHCLTILRPQMGIILFT